MNTDALEELNTVLDRKYYFTKERFYHYFSVIGCGNKELKEYWDIFEKFPRFNTDDIDKVIFVLDHIQNFPYPPEYKYRPDGGLFYKERENIKKVYYWHEEQIKTLQFNLNENVDIALYAEFIRKGNEIIVAVDLVESFYENSKTWLIFDGDIFTTSIKDIWFESERGEVFVATKDGYRRLLYTKGRGYVRNGKPDYDEKFRSNYALTSKDKFRYVGNIYADLSFLIDKSGEDEETEGDSE
jgi:hypothetical protein